MDLAVPRGCRFRLKPRGGERGGGTHQCDGDDGSTTHVSSSDLDDAVPFMNAKSGTPAAQRVLSRSGRPFRIRVQGGGDEGVSRSDTVAHKCARAGREARPRVDRGSNAAVAQLGSSDGARVRRDAVFGAVV